MKYSPTTRILAAAAVAASTTAIAAPAVLADPVTDLIGSAFGSVDTGSEDLLSQALPLVEQFMQDQQSQPQQQTVVYSFTPTTTQPANVNFSTSSTFTGLFSQLGSITVYQASSNGVSPAGTYPFTQAGNVFIGSNCTTAQVQGIGPSVTVTC